MARAAITLALTSAGSAVASTPAAASVRIDAQRIVVSGDGAGAVIERKPLRITYTGRDSAPVLAQVPDSGQAPVVAPPQPRPEPGGGDQFDPPTVYGPFPFTVGVHRSEQATSLGQGDQIMGVDGGVVYSAREVLDAKPKGADGVELTLSTSDPSGRRLVVTIAPDKETSVSVTALPVPSAGVAIMGDSFTSGRDEAFHGFGGRHNSIDQRGRDFYNWTEEENTNNTAGEGYQNAEPGTGQFPNGPTAAYYVQSLFASSRPYGFMLRRPELSFWRMASDREDAWQAQVAAARLDYTVAAGEPKQVVKTLTAITGRHQVPPTWAAGSQTTRLVAPGDGVGGAAAHEALVRRDLKMIDESNVPFDGYDLFGWQLILRQPGGEAKIRDLIGQFHRRGIHVTAYFPPFVEQSGSGYANPADFPDAVGKGLVATNPDRLTPSLFPTPLAAPIGALLDYTKPETLRWWEGKLREALDLGFDGFMQDFGEQATTEMTFANGDTGAEMHNKYDLFYHRATREIFDRYQREHPDRRLWFYTRSGYNTVKDSDGTDLPGSTTYESGNFPGDNNSDFSHANGLQSSAPDMLNRAIGGAYGYTTDIGGYLGTASKENFVRWAQWAALSPYFRLHNTSDSNTKQPWDFDAETLRIYRHAAELHQAARPYTLRLWQEAVRTGVPMTRPLWLEFPGDAEAAKQDQEWMLGPDVLVAPVVSGGAESREVYFPAGEWVHPETGERFSGPARVAYRAPLERLPYFFRAGTSPFAADAELGLPPSSSGPGACRSRRSFTIRLRAPRGQRLRSAQVFVNGRRVKVLRGRRLRTRIDLRGLPKGRYTVRIRARTTRGRSLTNTRRYRTCLVAERP